MTTKDMIETLELELANEKYLYNKTGFYEHAVSIRDIEKAICQLEMEISNGEVVTHE